MARVIQEYVKRPLAEELLFGKLANGGQALVTLAADGNGLAIECVPAPEPEVARLAVASGSSGRGRRCGPWSGRKGSSRRSPHRR